MKPIKYRSWDIENKAMYYNSQEKYFYEYSETGYVESIKPMIFYDNYIAMEYTGLQDKEGKEIYEGDVLKCKLCNGKYENYEVIWDDKYACFDALNKNRSNFICPSIWNEFEVIGNIYETPEW